MMEVKEEKKYLRGNAAWCQLSLKPQQRTGRESHTLVLDDMASMHPTACSAFLVWLIQSHAARRHSVCTACGFLAQPIKPSLGWQETESREPAHGALATKGKGPSALQWKGTGTSVVAMGKQLWRGMKGIALNIQLCKLMFSQIKKKLISNLKSKVKSSRYVALYQWDKNADKFQTQVNPTSAHYAPQLQIWK